MKSYAKKAFVFGLEIKKLEEIGEIWGVGAVICIMRKERRGS